MTSPLVKVAYLQLGRDYPKSLPTTMKIYASVTELIAKVIPHTLPSLFKPFPSISALLSCMYYNWLSSLVHLHKLSLLYKVKFPKPHMNFPAKCCLCHQSWSLPRSFFTAYKEPTSCSTFFLLPYNLIPSRSLMLFKHYFNNRMSWVYRN